MAGGGTLTLILAVGPAPIVCLYMGSLSRAGSARLCCCRFSSLVQPPICGPSVSLDYRPQAESTRLGNPPAFPSLLANWAPHLSCSSSAGSLLKAAVSQCITAYCLCVTACLWAAGMEHIASLQVVVVSSILLCITRALGFPRLSIASLLSQCHLFWFCYSLPGPYFYIS